MGKGKKRGSTEINASSMADIAFLLLIFFLVTTTIDQDKGILHGLPPWSEEDPPDIELREKNVLEILVNSNNQLLVEGQYMDVTDLKEIAVKHIGNNGRLPNFSVSPTKAIISLKNDRGTKYGTYIGVYNELKGAYNELRDELAQRRHGVDFDDESLTGQQRTDIKDFYPIILSEAEPTNFGEE